MVEKQEVSHGTMGWLFPHLTHNSTKDKVGTQGEMKEQRSSYLKDIGLSL